MPTACRPETAVRPATPRRELAALLAAAAALAGLAVPAPVAAQTTAGTPSVTMTVRARGVLLDGIGPVMQVRIGGKVVASREVRNGSFANISLTVPKPAAGAAVDVFYANNAWRHDQGRTLHVESVRVGHTGVFANAPGVRWDRGSGGAAFDGVDVVPGQVDLWVNGALRFKWPASGAPAADPSGWAASRFLQQASFGPTPAEITRLRSMTPAQWIDEQLARPYSAVYVPMMQQRFDRGAAWRPGGASYSPTWVTDTFWKTAATHPDQLRHRVAWALQQIFVVSLMHSDLWHHGRPYAQYLDHLAGGAFGSYRSLLQRVATSPVMGIYLSHIRNQKADPATGRVPDENFARELMQLFSIGLVELNPDGTPRLDDQGRPIATYGNADVMHLARVFTGWSWGFDDAQLTDANFLWGSPDYATTGSARIDLRPMKPYPKFHAPQDKRLFAGKPWARTIPAGTPPADALRIALDTLAAHPNVGPFIGRQLIQRLVTSNPSPAYVARVAAVFANDGQGRRGNLGAVVRAILLDPEAREPADAHAGKLREPVLRVAHWARAFGATSVTGEWRLAWELQDLSQRPQHALSVFNDFRPGYAPPTGEMRAAGLQGPEFQIANESTVAAWVNRAEALTGWGIGWTGSTADVTAPYTAEAAMVKTSPEGFVDHLNTLLFAGRMTPALRHHLLDAMYGVSPSSATRDRDRARVAVFLALASPEYLVQR
jgi:uncharacterized protein (DUF1800 family)